MIAVSASVLCLAVGAATAAAHGGHGSAAFAQFRACMKEHGAPALGHHRHRRPAADEVAAWKQAFAACRDLLPKRTAGDHGFTRPTAAQIEAFKACMAGKGFTLGKPGSGTRPNFRDKAVRQAFRAALTACRPLLASKPA